MSSSRRSGPRRSFESVACRPKALTAGVTLASFSTDWSPQTTAGVVTAVCGGGSRYAVLNRRTLSVSPVSRVGGHVLRQIDLGQSLGVQKLLRSIRAVKPIAVSEIDLGRYARTMETTSPGTPRPTAKDIAADIRQELVRGDLGPGDRLPAARDLAKKYGVTLVKVQNAYRELSEEGLVVSQQGRGTFVVDPSQPLDDNQQGGSAFLALAAELSAVNETVRRLGERLDRLERNAGSDRSDLPR